MSQSCKSITERAEFTGTSDRARVPKVLLNLKLRVQKVIKWLTRLKVIVSHLP